MNVCPCFYVVRCQYRAKNMQNFRSLIGHLVYISPDICPSVLYREEI